MDIQIFAVINLIGSSPVRLPESKERMLALKKDFLMKGDEKP